MKNKFLKIVIIFVILFLFTINKASALTSDEISKLDSDGKISMPLYIYSDGSSITIHDTTDYKLSYQWQEITMDLYNNIINKNNEIEDLYDEAMEYSKNNRPDASDSSAVDEYNKKIKEYNEQLSTLQEEYYSLLPSFKSEWTYVENSENKVYPPSDLFTGTKPFVLYLKLEDNQDGTTSYDYGVLQLDGNNDNSKVEDQVITDNSEVKKITTTTNEINPKTIDNNIYTITILIIIFSILIILGIVKLKKNKSY